MKVLSIFIVVLGFFITPQAAFAEVSVSVSGNNSESNVSVHQEGSNESTICINGKCETTGSTGKTTVCHNGDCKTSDDGNYHYESEDGTTKVHVENNSASDQAKPSQDDKMFPTISQPTSVVDPKIQEKIDEAKKKAEEARKEAEETRERIKERIKSEDSIFSAFLEAEIKSLQQLFEKLF